MAYADKSATKAADVLFENGSGMPPAGANAADNALSTVMDHARFATMIALQNRLLSIMAEAKTIVQHLQQNGFFPRSNGATPDEDAANAIMHMLRSSLEAPVPPTTLTLNGMGCGPATTNGEGTLPLPSFYSSELPATADSTLFRAPTKSSPEENSHIRENTNGVANTANSRNVVDEFFLSGLGAQESHATEAAEEQAAEDGPDVLPEGADILAFVEFKRGRVRKYVCDHRIEPGNYVLVDGDRGTDCGLLVQTITRMPNNETAVVSMEGCDICDEKIKLENGRVLRKASEEDIDRLHNIIANAESVALKTCRQRCLELGIDIDLQDVEYQFDMKKISFFFDCDHSVDFRSLVRELYRTFGARIWMENTNPRVKNSMPESTGQERGHGGGHHGNGGGHHGNGGGHHGNGSGWRNNNRGARSRDY